MRLLPTDESLSARTRILGQRHSLVEELEAGLADAHFLLDAKLGDGRVLGGALATEDLPTCPAVVLRSRAGVGVGGCNQNSN